VSVFLGQPSSPKHVGSDWGRAQELDGAQMVAAEGPSFTAWETRTTVTSRDLHSDSRWPHLAERIGRVEVGMAMAVPVLREDRGGGVLNLYARRRRLLDDEESRVARLVADTVAAVLQEMDEKAELETLADQLQEALQSRAVIEQAKGMIMLQEHCDADAAFKRLVRLSSESNVKLREVARLLVDGSIHH
jgi:GAF domain-containing protein